MKPLKSANIIAFRWTSASELDSNCISQGERVVPYLDLPFGSSTPFSVPGHEEPCARSAEIVVVGLSSESFPAPCPAAENLHCVPRGSASTWEYHYQYGMDTHLQLFDQAAALKLEPLDSFESGLLPLEPQNDVQASNPWGSLGMFHPFL